MSNRFFLRIYHPDKPIRVEERELVFCFDEEDAKELLDGVIENYPGCGVSIHWQQEGSLRAICRNVLLCEAAGDDPASASAP